MPDAWYPQRTFGEGTRRDHETLGWLNAAEKSFEFWNNPADDVYDDL